MNRAEKTKVEENLRERFKTSNGVFVADYQGLTVADITSLRFELKKTKTDLKVVKNRMALRAMNAPEFTPSFKAHFDRMTAVAIVDGDVSAAAKAVTKFAKENSKFKIRGGWLENKEVSLDGIKALSTLPSRAELLAKLLGTWLAVPQGFVRVLNGVPAKWVYVLDAVKQKKSQG